MTSQPPYWGQLPAPTSGVPRPGVHSKAPGRRYSNDDSPTADRTPRRANPNRVSVQTTNTDAPTESTLSPYASPTASAFADQGLAPRPPSFPYGADRYAHDGPPARRRRPSTEPDDDDDPPDDDAADGSPLPAAPDVPRAPPVSFRHPYGNGGLPFTVPTAPGIPRSARAPDPYQMDPEQYYKAAAAKALAAGRPGPGDEPLQRRGTGPKEPGGRRRSSTDQPTQHRKASTSSQSERQKTLADERSPLQRLELTLDSMTKGEKRALLELAEQELEAKQPERTPSQRTRFQEPQSPGAPEGAKAPRIAAHRGPLSQNPPEGGKRYASAPERAARGDPRIPGSALAEASGIQRNLSFRERAERNDLKLPRANGSESPAGAGAPLNRAGSNKLRKEPPAEPWAARRGGETERKYPTTQARTGPPLDSPDAEAPPIRGPGRGSVRIKEGPVEHPTRGPPAAESSPADPGSARGQRPVATKLSKTPSQRRPPEGQVAHRAGPPAPDRGDVAAERPAKPSHLAPATAVAAGVAVAGAAGGVAAAKRSAQRREDGDSSDDGDGFGQHSHRVSNLVYRARNKMKPGQGIYRPPVYLDEWKEGTVGRLSGTALDLGYEVPPPGPTENDQAWWETPPSKRRGSAPPRPMNAEAFDGEYDESNNGMHILHVSFFVRREHDGRPCLL